MKIWACRFTFKKTIVAIEIYIIIYFKEIWWKFVLINKSNIFFYQWDILMMENIIRKFLSLNNMSTPRPCDLHHPPICLCFYSLLQLLSTHSIPLIMWVSQVTQLILPSHHFFVHTLDSIVIPTKIIEIPSDTTIIMFSKAHTNIGVDDTMLHPLCKRLIVDLCINMSTFFLLYNMTTT